LEFNYFLSAFPNEQEYGDEYRTLFEFHFLKIKKRTAEIISTISGENIFCS